MPSIIAFAGDRRIAAGEPIDVALAVKRRLDPLGLLGRGTLFESVQ